MAAKKRGSKAHVASTADILKALRNQGKTYDVLKGPAIGPLKPATYDPGVAHEKTVGGWRTPRTTDPLPGRPTLRLKKRRILLR